METDNADGPRKLGQAFDSAVTARRRLATAHLVLAIASSFGMWTGAESPMSIMSWRAADFMMIVLSVWGWAPYLVSWFYSRSYLDDNRRAVLAFIPSATVCALIAIALTRCAITAHHRPMAMLVAVCLTIALIALAGICGAIFSERTGPNPYG